MGQTFLGKLSTDSELNGNSRVCLGLDIDPEKMPQGKSGKPFGHGSLQNRVFEFASAIVEATHDCVAIYKPNFWFWAAIGAEQQLRATIDLIHAKGVQVILDFKGNDIGNTAAQAAYMAFERYDADAVTLNAYMGSDTLSPYLEYGNSHGLFVLSRTSNPGAGELQDKVIKGGRCVYLEVARNAVRARKEGQAQVGLVMGATSPDEIAAAAEFVGNPGSIPLLIPGIGAQGGDLEATVQRAKRFPFVINSSRGILYASKNRRKFAGAARVETVKLRDNINQALAEC